MLGVRSVDGRFRRLRTGAYAALIAILLAIPWISIGGEPLVLLDVPARKFHVFGLVIYPQELYFLWLILAALALALFFFTALFGRVWCGWACPQTVFTDLFAAVARRLQGWRGLTPPARVAPWRRAATYAAFAALSLVLGFHLVAYFRPPRALLQALAHGDVRSTSFTFLLAGSFLAFFDFVVLRQTFCKYLCPYARFQGVLFDDDTLVIGYDAERGEPRGKVVKRPEGAGTAAARGDCVDCGLCVAVCPTGIDIRKGMQMECIACTQCIDACDDVMAHLGRAANLIGYRSLVSLTGERAARILRPRVALYGALLVAVSIAFALALSRRLPMDLTVAHNHDTLYVRAADGRVGNSFKLHIQNRDRSEGVFSVRIVEDGFDLVAGVNPIRVPATDEVAAQVFVLAEEEDLAGPAAPIHFVLEREGPGGARVVRPARFLAPDARSGGAHDDDR